MPIFGGRSNYPYVCARVKAKKSFLLSKDAYHRMLGMDLSEIGRYLGETQYRDEMAALSGKYSGATLIEIGISQNLAKTYSDVISYAGGHLKEIIAEYLHRWDIYNIKTIIRGKVTKAPIEEIREILIQAGSLKPELINQLIQASSNEEILEALRKQSVVYVDEELFRNALTTGKLAALEDALDKEYYLSLLKSIKETTVAEKRLSDFIRREIDIVNLKVLFKLKIEGAVGESMSQYFIPGGMEFKSDRLAKLAAASSTKEIIDDIRQSSYSEYILPELEEFEEKKDVSSLLRAMDKALIEISDKFSHLYPLSVLPVLDYVLRKKTEVDNIRIIARGKESGLDPELIKKLLVL
ncbi:MAG: ATP synthase A1 subunit C [Thermoplasmata archaeon]